MVFFLFVFKAICSGTCNLIICKRNNKNKDNKAFYSLISYLVIEIPRVPLVVLVAAVLGRGFLPLCVVSHVVLKHTGESYG